MGIRFLLQSYQLSSPDEIVQIKSSYKTSNYVNTKI